MVASGGRGKPTSGKKFVSGSSQLIASSVSSGLALSAERRGTTRASVKSLRAPQSPPPVFSTIAVPLALQARGDFPFNNIIKVSEMKLLEKLEGGGVVVEENGLAVMYEADTDIESKLTGTLNVHLSAWRHIGAGAFSISVIENGYIPKLGPMPNFYSEANNKSYRENVDFANDAVMKPLKVGVIEEVSKSRLRCVNPLTVAQNTDKKHLCIDLSCCFNEQCDVQKFKIESTVQ